MPIYGMAEMSSLISLVPLHRGERNVDKLGLGFDFRFRDTDDDYKSHL